MFIKWLEPVEIKRPMEAYYKAASHEKPPKYKSGEPMKEGDLVKITTDDLDNQSALIVTLLTNGRVTVGFIIKEDGELAYRQNVTIPQNGDITLVAQAKNYNYAMPVRTISKNNLLVMPSREVA